MRILIDQDGVLADWGKMWDETLDLYGASKAIPRHANQRSFDLKANLNVADRAMVSRVMETPGFYSDLDPIPGAIAALKEMVAEGHDVKIVTSPFYSNPTCIEDKVEWVRRHLGSKWLSRIILAGDKTAVAGDILIDDKPAITGTQPPEWEHVYFDQPYNRVGANDEVSPLRRRLTRWEDWRELLAPPAAPSPDAPARGRLIGMGGLFASGKDTVADHLVEKHGFVKVNMSTVLHQAMLALDPWIPLEVISPLGRQKDFTTYATLVQNVGYTEAKTNPEVRRLLQALGTDVGRNIIGENVWVDIVGRQIKKLLAEGTNVVISGIRFPNELDMVRDLGGKLWWTDRGGESTSTHASENSVGETDFDRVIENHGTIEDLHALVNFLWLPLRITGHFDSRKHLWGVDAAWEGPDYPKPLAVVAPKFATGGRIIAGGSPASGSVGSIFASGTPIQSTDLRALNEAIDDDFSPLVGIHLNEESRTAA